MNHNSLLLSLLLLLPGVPTHAQEAVSVGKGSYAAYTPYYKSKTDEHAGDQSMSMQHRKLYIRERAGQPIPTNDWWTNLITDRYSGHLWSYPQMVQAQSYGVDIQWPSYWIEDGTEMKSRTVLRVTGDGFAPESAVAETWHDWDVEFSMTDRAQPSRRMLVTMAHGMPFTWIETRSLTPQLNVGADAVVTPHGDALTVRMGDDLYGVYLPQGTRTEREGGLVTLRLPQADGYLVVALLRSEQDLDYFSPFAYNVPRSTEVTWSYEPTRGKVVTRWNVQADNLRGDGDGRVLQGFIPHHYRNGATPAFGFTDRSYRTPHGLLRLAEGQSFEISYDFHGMLPYYAAPTNSQTGQHPFIESRMLEMLRNYASTGGFGADTYWGGKSLTQMALNMMFAREMGQEALFRECRDKLKSAMVDWLTYTPGEPNFFFARYDRWGALVGYDTSYDSDTFNDHHFHYGYFTLAGALLALVDDDFRDNYGQMLRLVAKDYANWERSDQRFPFFRTFDPWAGHSFAGGMGDGNGNGQESSSEAMQGWGGVYLLGVALGDDAMRDAGLFGWTAEARGTAEYWFDRHGEAIDGAFHTGNREEYNIDYTKFAHPYNSNLTCHGVGYWTYFGYNSLYMQGIQWMPISPALDYLSEDKAFVAWDYEKMFADMANGGWLRSTANANGYLGDAGGWGNVAMAYYQRANPEGVAAIFDDLWDHNEPEARTVNTNGITYFVTHSHLSHGDLDWQSWGSIPTSRVYRKPDGSYTYMAYNPKSTPETVDFYVNGVKQYTMTAQPRQLTVSGVTSRALSEIATAPTTPADSREELEMVNLAQGRTVTASSEENVGTVAASLNDGRHDTRWGSSHADDQWVTVDFGSEATLYKLRLHWEAAYASSYKVLLSDDGLNFREVQTVSSDGGYDELLMGDARGRYLRIQGVRRATAYGISLYELEAYGKLATMSAGDVMGVKITSEAAQLRQHQPTQLHIKAYTCAGEWRDVTPVWSSAQGQVTPEGRFTPAVYGTATVSAEVEGLKVSKSFPVEEALRLKSLSLEASRTEAVTGERVRLTVSGVNQFGTPMTPTDAAIEVMTPGADFSPADSTLTAQTPGTYRVRVVQGALADTVAVSFKRFADVNLALNKPVQASSSENDGMLPANATDGNGQTRWGSAWNGLTVADADNQHLTVDLLQRYMVHRVVISWEAAHASSYDLQTSVDGRTWHTVKTVTCQGGQETVTFDETEARYVRMQGRGRNMGYGYSIYEMEVYGTRAVEPQAVTLRMDRDIEVFSADRDLDFTGVQGLQPYLVSGYIKGADPVLVITPVTLVPAGTGVLLYGQAGATYQVGLGGGNAIYANLLKATVEAVSVASTTEGYTNMMFDGRSFVTFEGSRQCGAGKAYLHLPDGVLPTGAKSIQWVLEGQTTGLGEVTAAEAADDGYYTLEGMKLQRPTRRGVYIHRGRKVIVR